MARLPSAADLGPTPRAEGSRPVAGFDVSGLARGVNALAESNQKIAAGYVAAGKGIAEAGAGAGELAIDENRWQYSRANADFLTKKIELDTNVAKDTDYATLPQRYEEQLGKIVSDSSASISEPRMRERFAGDIQPKVAEGIAKTKLHAFGLEANSTLADVQVQGNKFINQAIAAPDEDTRRDVIDAHNAQVDGLLAKGYIKPTDAVAMKQNWAKQYATADLLARSDQDPESVINELRAVPGTPNDVTNRILKIEGSGQNPNSSATGAGQFIKSTWLDVLKRNRPDLAEGRTDDQLLALRADKRLGRDMTEAYRSENEAFLKSKGIEATPGNQYLAHFLGAGGAAAVLKADPNMPVADVLAKAVGKDQAAKMVAANPSILGGQLAGSVTQWANNKMGGSAPGGGSIYDVLPPDQRETILAHAQGVLQKRNVNDLTAFKARIEDNQAEAAATGNVTKPIDESEFIGKLGADLGSQAYKQHQATVQLGRDMAGVARLDPYEQDALLKSYTPQAGEGFAVGAQRFTQLKQAVDRANKEKQDDPGGFAVARLPATGESFRAFIDARSNPLAKPADLQAAARTFANNTLLEQQQVGISSDQQKILPKGYADTFNAKVSKPAEAGGSINIVAMIENEARMWGENWPKVYRELARNAQPVVRVIGSGIKPGAAQILAETEKIQLGDILKDQDAEKSATVKKDVLDAFKPLAASMTGQEGAINSFNDFRSQGEKLAAYYVMRGKTSSEAATQAFDDLVGYKYDFSAGTYRLPKSVPFTPAMIADGVTAAKSSLDKMDIAPARDTIGGLTPDYLKKATVSAYARDGVWVTAPDESGLALVYNDQAVRKTDGKPVVLSWDQLGKMGQAHNKAAAERIDAAPFGQAPIP